MSSKTNRCRICNENLREKILPEFSGSYEGLTIKFSNLPCLTCNDINHPKKYIHLEFGSMLIDKIFSNNKKPIAKNSLFSTKML